MRKDQLVVLILTLKMVQVFQDIRGGYTGNVTMNSVNIDFLVNGICLAGGSLAGLEVITGSASEKMKCYELPVINGAIISNKIMTPSNGLC